MGGRLPRGRRVAISVLAIAGSVALLVGAGLAGADAGAPTWTTITDLLVGAAFLLAGATALAPPLPRVLAAATGALWLLGSIVPELGAAHRAALAACLVVFPSARITGPIPWTLVALSLPVASGLVPLPIVAALFAAIAAARIAAGEPDAAGRRRLGGPAAGAVGSAIAMATAIAASATAASVTPRFLDSASVLFIYEAVLLGVAATLVASSRLRPFRTAELPDTLLASGDVGVAGLESLLREVLRDPDVRILPPDASATSPDPTGGGDRRPGGVEEIDVLDDGAPVAVLVHGTGSIPDDRTARSIVEAVRLAAVHERTTAELERQRAELAAARTRMDEAAERRRQELATRLRDGVLAPIDDARAAVAGAATHAVSPDSRAALAVVADELAGTEREVRGIVDGSLRELGDGRLHDALRTLAARHATVEVSIEPEAIGDSETESTLRFVAFELVTNALKHASAERVLVRLSRADGRLILTVADDGCGGADREGSGIAGLAARVEAHGGRLSVSSPLGAGTTATAALRLSRPSSTVRR